MANSNDNNEDLMQALESLRSLIDNKSDVSRHIDDMAIPTLTPETPIPTPQTHRYNHHPSESIPLTVERQEVQLEIPVSNTADLEQEFEDSFDAFWKILKPKLKKAAKESYKELLAKQNSP